MRLMRKGKWENAQQLNNNAAGGRTGEASSGINSTFRGVNVPNHQRCVRGKGKMILLSEELEWCGGRMGGTMTLGCCCASLNSRHKQTHTHTERIEQTKAYTQGYI